MLARDSFWHAYSSLDSRARLAARRAYELFARNPEHPSLRFKKLQGTERVWSVRINEQYRAVGERIGDTIEWAGLALTTILTGDSANFRAHMRCVIISGV